MKIVGRLYIFRAFFTPNPQSKAHSFLPPSLFFPCLTATLTKTEPPISSNLPKLQTLEFPHRIKQSRLQKIQAFPHQTPGIPMSDTWCSECKRATEVVFDHAAGDTICSECGLVLESHSIDETSEWRTFANESNDNDPVRVGGPYNPLLTDGGLSTLISKPNGSSGEYLNSSLGKWQGRGANPDRNLINAFKSIAVMSDR